MNRISTAAFALLCPLLLANRTQAIVVNFDNYVFAGATSFAPADQFKSQGAIFDRTVPVEAVAIAEADVVGQFITLGGTLPNALALQTPNGLEIDMSFVVPGTNTPAVVNSVSSLFWDTQVGSLLGRIEGFGVNGTSLGSVQAATTSTNGGVQTLSAPGIRRVRLSVDSDGANLDNITFPTPIAVPEPCTIALLGIGSLAMLRYCRRANAA
jgi:hypothetical protein